MKEEILLAKSPSIFLADDDEDDVYFVKTAVRELDSLIKVKHFVNGKQLLQALTKSKSQPPNFILLDLNMPILNGRETLRLIRKFYDHHLPVIILSTSNHQHEKDLCFEYGATAYYTKPCSYPLYLEILRELKEKWISEVLVEVQRPPKPLRHLGH
jgi:CheY-like chemotaxis protein